MSRPRLVTGAVTAGIFHFCSAEDQILIPSDPYLSFHIKINGSANSTFKRYPNNDLNDMLQGIDEWVNI